MITSACALLAGTFAALGALPVTFLAELGFAAAFSVLLDTIVVRSVLATALNLDRVGRSGGPAGSPVSPPEAAGERATIAR